MRVLIETRMNSLRLTESKTPKKGCLGRLEGVCADFKNPTRNGRLYPLDLWKKVFDDSLFKESLENKTLFGELDHPEDRFEPLISEACVVMTDYRIDESKGLIYGGFDILDTPKGKILKSILDYGSVVGVSSRGQGDIIESADGERVDEDSYEFACFDVVSTPAVEKARQSVTESIKRINAKDFNESVHKQIDDADTIADLNIIRSVVRTAKLNDSEMHSLIECIEDKCKSLQKVGETISTEKEEKSSDNNLTESAKTIRDNKKLYSCIRNLNEKISAYRYRETRYVETIESKDSEISSLQNDIRKLKRLQKQNESKTKQVRESLSKKLQITKDKSNEESNRYESIIESLRSKNDSLQSDLINKSNDFNDGLSRKETELSNLQERLNKSNDRIAYLENQLESVSKAHESDIKSIDSEVEDYTRLLSEAKDKIDNGNATIKELKESLNNANKALQSTKSINLTLSDGLKKFQESYLSKVSKAVGIDARALSSSVTRDTTPDQIDSLVEAMRDRIDRHNRVGISKNGIDVDKDYIVNTTKDDSADALENNRLISFLQSAQGSL